MAAKKGTAKKTKTVYRKAKTKHHKPSANHIAVALGALATGGAIAYGNAVAKGGNASAVEWAKNKSQSFTNRALYAGSALKANALTPAVYVPLVIGAAASASPRIPLVRIVARPVDRMAKKLSHGRWGV